MSIWGAIASTLGFAPQAATPSVPSSTVSRGSDVGNAFFGPTNTGGLLTPTEHTASTVTAVEACVRVIGGGLASMPINIFERGPDGLSRQLADEPLWGVLNTEYSPRWSAAMGSEYLSRSFLLRGDGFAAIRRNRMGEPTGLEPFHPQRVTVYLTPSKRLLYAVEPEGLPGEVREVLDQDDMLHFASDGFDGLRSPSPLRTYLKNSVAAALAMQDYAGAFFANGARPDYLIEQHPTSTELIDQKAIERLKEMIAENHQGLANARRPMLLTGGMTFKPVTLPLEDVQLLGLRQFAVEEVARAYGVPPFMIGHNEKTTSWGSGVEAMGIGFVRYTLRTHINRMSNELNRKLFARDPRRRFVQFDTSELERADTKTLYDAYGVALGGSGRVGWMTANDVRRRENRPPIDGGDTLADGSGKAPEKDQKNA